MSRANEYNQLSIPARWLDNEKAAHAYAFASQFDNRNRYGLNEATVSNIESLSIGSYSVADAWLRARMPATGTVQVVYGRREVCVVDTTDFLAHWYNIFMPCRDDAIVVHNLESIVLFYCHEQVLEIGRRVI